MSEEKAKRKVVGRPRAFKDVRAFERAVDGYFVSISRTVPMKDEDGRVIYNDALEPVKRREFVLPPTFSGLLLHLGITKKTWWNYANMTEAQDPEAGAYRWICERAKGIIEAYLEGELLTRRKGIQGVIFNLTNNFSWTDRREVELGPQARQTIAESQSMSMEEKMALIQEAAAEAAADGAPAGPVRWGEEERNQRLSPTQSGGGGKAISATTKAAGELPGEE